MSNQAKITCTNVWKLFGPDEKRIIKGLDKNLSIKEVQEKTGHVVAVKDVSFSIEKGETFVVMGLSGSGKSTLVRCISRLIEPTSGTVKMDDVDVTKMSGRDLLDLRRNKMSMVFQHFGLFPHRTVVENIGYGLEIRGNKKNDRTEKSMEVLKMVGLEGWQNNYPRELSGGMQQRVGLARALAVDPEILIFDEPFSALDPLIRREMQDELLKIQEKLQKTMVFITHDFLEAIKMGDAIMKDGEVSQVGTPEEIYNDPANIFVAQFIGTPKMNILEVSEQNIISENTIKILENNIQFDQLKLNKSKHFVGIRPEHLKANQENQFSFNPEIELIENLGNEKIAYMKKNEHQLSAKVPSNIEIGNKIGFDLNDLFIFDENGNRLKS